MNKKRVAKCSCGKEIEFYQKDTYRRFWRIERDIKYNIRFIVCPNCRNKVRTDNQKALDKKRKS